MAVPPDPQHRVDLSRDTGRAFRYQNELFAENSWVQELSDFLNGICDKVSHTVAQLPPHQLYVETYCKAVQPSHLDSKAILAELPGAASRSGNQALECERQAHRQQNALFRDV